MVLKIHWNILMTMLFCHSVKASENISFNKTSSQSTSWDDYPSSLAVDGNTDCYTKYTHTNENEQSAWWQVNLGDVYEIKRIDIYYRTRGYAYRLNGYSIEIALNDPSYQDAWQCYKDFNISQLPSSTPSHICRRLGQYVKLYVERLPNLTYSDYDGKGAVINLCEFEVFGCPQGSYGNLDCKSNCSVGCFNSRCDPDNGKCNCSSGLWSGDKCDHIHCNTSSYLQGDRCVSCSTGCVDNNCNVETGECSKGCNPSFYGTFCNLTCTQNCYNTSCARDTGRCIGCKIGFYGDTCDKICPRNCNDIACKQDNGYCTNCTHPYKGNTCTECVDGYYGDKCTNCSEGCLERTCGKINGQCTCKESFFGNTCNQFCPENCKNNRCNQTTGDCVDGCKKLFVIGKKCNVLALDNTGNSGSQTQTNNTGPIIAGIVAVIVVIVTAVVIVLFLKRRRRKETVYENQIPLNWTQEGRNQQDNNQLEQQQTVHYETLGLHDRGYVNTNSVQTYTGLNVNTQGRY